MLTAVLIANFLLGCGCLLAARKLWQWRQTLANAADALLAAETAVHRVLYPAPRAIRKAQRATLQLQQGYLQLDAQAQQVQQVIELVMWGQLMWRRQWRRSRRESLRSPDSHR